MARDRSAIRICRWGNAARCSEGDGRGRTRVGRWAALILFHAGLAVPATTNSARMNALPQEPNSSQGQAYAHDADLTTRQPRFIAIATGKARLCQSVSTYAVAVTTN